ncbi:MAG: hypothetical protein U1F66_11650 [bacterium]
MSQAMNPLERAGAALGEWATCMEERVHDTGDAGNVLVCADEDTRTLAVAKFGDYSPLASSAGQSDSFTLDDQSLCQLEQAFRPVATEESFGQQLTQFTQELRSTEATLQDSSLSPQEAVKKAEGHLASAIESFNKIQESHACSPNLAKRIEGMAEKVQKFAEEKGIPPSHGRRVGEEVSGILVRQHEMVVSAEPKERPILLKPLHPMTR